MATPRKLDAGSLAATPSIAATLPATAGTYLTSRYSPLTGGARNETSAVRQTGLKLPYYGTATTGSTAATPKNLTTYTAPGGIAETAAQYQTDMDWNAANADYDPLNYSNPNAAYMRNPYTGQYDYTGWTGPEQYAQAGMPGSGYLNPGAQAEHQANYAQKLAEQVSAQSVNPGMASISVPTTTMQQIADQVAATPGATPLYTSSNISPQGILTTSTGNQIDLANMDWLTAAHSYSAEVQDAWLQYHTGKMRS